MSKDKMPAILNAVNTLPVRQRGLALGLLSTLCAVKRYPDAPKVLKDAINGIRKPATKAVVETFDSSKYFATREGLFVHSEFTTRILPAYQGLIPKRGIKGIESIDLPRHMFDHDIVVEFLGGMEEVRKCAFTPDQIADLIDTQEGDKAGALLNGGYLNILYMIGVYGILFPVNVIWEAHLSDWSVDAYEFDSADWSAGNRVLCNKN